MVQFARELIRRLPAAKAVVTSGSSTALEAVCQGILVVLIGRQAGLNFNPLEGVDSRMWAIVYTPEDLGEVIARKFSEDQLRPNDGPPLHKLCEKLFS